MYRGRLANEKIVCSNPHSTAYFANQTLTVNLSKEDQEERERGRKKDIE